MTVTSRQNFNFNIQYFINNFKNVYPFPRLWEISLYKRLFRKIVFVTRRKNHRENPPSPLQDPFHSR